MRWQTARTLVLRCSLLLLLLAVPALNLTSRAAAPAAPAGTCTTNEQCAKDEFCAKFAASCEDHGKCEARPQDCTERGKVLLKPVCGCDDRSYDNFCLAAAAGVNVKHEGKCAS